MKTAKKIAENERRRTFAARRNLVKPVPFLVGRRVYLEPLSMNHFSKVYLRWLNDSVVCRYTGHSVFPYTPVQMKKFLESASKHNDKMYFAVRLKSNSKHIGNAALINIFWIDRSLEISLLIGDKSQWGKRIGLEICQLLRDYAFNTLNMHRVWMGMIAEHQSMAKIAKQMGMKQEGCFKEIFYKNGCNHDVRQFYVLNPTDNKRRV